MTSSRYIGCSGFFGPPTRYWPLFNCVEITDTESLTPGDASVRRWLREAPKGYAFSVLMPKEIGQEGFATVGKDAPRFNEVADVAATLNAEAIVFAAPSDFAPTSVNKSRLRAFIDALPKGVPTAVFDLPAFSLDEAMAVADTKRSIVATHPLTRNPKPRKDLIYHRLPGPAGHRSRYDEDALQRIAAGLRESNATTTFCILSNIDALTNATALSRLMK